MEIIDIDVHTLALPETEAVADGTQDATIVEVKTDKGITGIGEAADSSPAIVESVFEAPVSHQTSIGLKEILIGRDPLDVGVLWDEMFEKLGLTEGRSGAALCAISAADIALWDIYGKAMEQPVYQLLGGKHRDSVPVYASTLFPEDRSDTDYMKREAERILDQGFSGVKFGWGAFGEDEDADRELVRAARETLGSTVDLMVDCGLCWRRDVKAATKQINRLDKAFDLYFAEEPLHPDDYDGYSALSDACETRIAAGEREATYYGFADLIAKGNLDAIQPDVARAGGITQLSKIGTLADVAGIPMIPHGYSTDILVSASLHVLVSRGYAPYLEYVVEESPLRWETTNENFGIEDGAITVSEKPGLGVSLNRDAIDQYRVDL